MNAQTIANRNSKRTKARYDKRHSCEIRHMLDFWRIAINHDRSIKKETITVMAMKLFPLFGDLGMDMSTLKFMPGQSAEGKFASIVQSATTAAAYIKMDLEATRRELDDAKNELDRLKRVIITFAEEHPFLSSLIEQDLPSV